MYDKNLMKMRRGKVSALMMAVMLAATACGNGGDTPVTQPLEGSSGSDQVSTPEPTPEITAAPTPEATASPTPKPTPTPEPTPSPTPPPITTNGELSSIGTYAPAETFSDRALVAVKAEEGIFVSWRCYEADSKDITFTLERNGAAVYTGNRTSFLDTAGKSGDTYKLTASEGISTGGESTKAWGDVYQELTLQAPPAQTMPDGTVTAYTSNDMSVGDLDGDGQLELIVKWYPGNAQDNSKDGYTGTTILDAYDIDLGEGKAALMWRIDLGLNIRSGAHYTQFQVWDYDGDGKAELICKTADGSTTFDANLNETGHVGQVSVKDLPTNVKGTPETYDFRQHKGRLGRIVLGQEYLTAFNGETGEIIDTVKYIPERGPYDAEKGIYDTRYWGLKGKSPAESNDGYANRADRFLAGTGYLDDGSASAIFCRGYYGRSALTAWKLINGKLEMQWAFDVDSYSEYAAQGNHQLSINDVDGDGYDEVVYGSLVVDHDGTPMYTTGLGHGDAMHVSDWNNDGKLEVFCVHEEKTADYGLELHDAQTGEIIWGVRMGKDIGRGMAADIDPRYEGAEMWSASNETVYDCKGNPTDIKRPSINFSIYWDGDLLMELFDSNNSDELMPRVQKWDWENKKSVDILQAPGTQLNNTTKANAGILADLYGDWREEFIVGDKEYNNKIRIYSTNIPTEYVFPCLLENRTYREGIAWQNTAYNQPANLPYLLTEEMSR
jgi:rhamnogalacturonan endolyase/rhamnogalacturonan exolyase